MKLRILALILLITLLLTSCRNKDNGIKDPTNPGGQGGNSDITGDDSSYGEDLEDLGAMDGFFDEDVRDIEIKCISGTPNCYKIEGNVLTFTAVSTESVYSITGKFAGSIVIDTGDAYKFDLELHNFSIVSDSVNPITVLSGDEVSIQAKKDTENFIYDTRPAISEEDTTSLSGAIHSEVDLEIAGKGRLSVVSSNNKGIHSKKDLQVKNLNLTVSCKDNALKGNDSVELENANAILIATIGDCIKTTNSDISAKGNQRGVVSFLGGSYELYAACDGIDASYDVVIDDENTVVNIYTDKYSNYSEEVTKVSEDCLYIRFNYSEYSYSVKYYNSDDDYLWVNAEHHSTVSGGRTQYHYYSFPKNNAYQKLQFFMYSSDMEQGQESDYMVCSDLITVSDAYDTIALSNRGSNIYYNWTNYSSTVNDFGPGGMGPGGMNDGNTDKGDHSTKGIKAANEIKINSGTVNIKSYDDGIHAKSGEALENGATSTGTVTINGGYLTIYSNDDGIHADGTLTINNGNISVINSYEGMEGTSVNILGGNVSVISKDDGINGTITSGAAITVGGGTLYVYCGGDGIDSNSRSSYGGIVFSGGKTLIISTSGGNSAIDSEAGYSYSGGSVVAIMPRGGMSSEATRCQNFSSVGKKAELSLTNGRYLVCEIGGDKLTVNMPTSISALIVMLGSNGASATTNATDSHNLSEGEFIWD